MATFNPFLDYQVLMPKPHTPPIAVQYDVDKVPDFLVPAVKIGFSEQRKPYGTPLQPERSTLQALPVTTKLPAKEAWSAPKAGRQHWADYQHAPDIPHPDIKQEDLLAALAGVRPSVSRIAPFF